MFAINSASIPAWAAVPRYKSMPVDASALSSVIMMVVEDGMDNGGNSEGEGGV